MGSTFLVYPLLRRCRWSFASDSGFVGMVSCFVPVYGLYCPPRCSWFHASDTRDMDRSAGSTGPPGG